MTLGTDVGHVTVIAESAKAILCSWDDGEEAWVPKSAIDEESEVGIRGDRGILIIPRWLAEKLERVDRNGWTTTPTKEREAKGRKVARRA